ncbi:hypothetical protein PENTCL1PPCAC_15490 [Pristionchus entomophagus]|uniref:Uncharacterized protein n=1 Tax=Pristionchus entomophagus TaxID=358040 RepID=A0AAV5TGQ6_9BILA|nr:hypothetical protein PENTCL1PPCAC_15490 [Pristionchus entomophagus]
MRASFLLAFIFAVSYAQMMPGSTNGIIANGRGGLGRYIRHLEGRDGSSYYGNGNEFGYYGYAPVASTTHSARRATTVIFIVLLVIAFATAQLLPGSTTGAVTNGRSGLGRLQRHLENCDQSGYYYYGNDFNQGFYPYGQFAFFG